MSNTFYNHLDGESQTGLIEMEPMEARNVGIIKAWRTGTPQSLATFPERARPRAQQ